MTMQSKIAAAGLAAVVLADLCSPAARGQGPEVLAPIVVNTAVPIVVNAVKPKPSGLAKFEGFVMHASAVQITVRAKGNDMSIQTFALSEAAGAKMRETIDKGGFQYGDKVTVLYDPSSLKAVKVKGKPSPAL
jgi:hypothetical protein